MSIGARRLLQRGVRLAGRAGLPGAILAVLVLSAVFADLLAPHPLRDCFLSRSFQGPSLTHPLGTDLQGCDLLTRTMHGARTSLLIAGVVSVGAATIATVVGTLSAWRGGWLDAVLSRSTDALFAIPPLLTALVLFGITRERTLGQVIAILTVTTWPPLVRIVRASVVEVLEREHVQAAWALGAGPWRVLRHHVLPHVVQPLLVYALPFAASVVSLEAVLSFVGAGLQLPTVSWGLMLSNLGGRLGVGLRVVQAPHLLAPGVALSLLVYALLGLSRRIHRDAHDLGVG